MKNYKQRSKLIFFFSLYSVLNYSQTFQEVTKIGSFYGKTFSELEQGIGVKSIDAEIKFGIESRAYSNQTYSILVSETEDNDLIGSILLLGKKGLEHENTWYSLVKYADENQECTFIDGFYGDRKNAIYKYKIYLKDMLPLLRANVDLSETVYYLIYKYRNLYYHFCIVDGGFMIRIEKNLPKQINAK